MMILKGLYPVGSHTPPGEWAQILGRLALGVDTGAGVTVQTGGRRRSNHGNVALSRERANSAGGGNDMYTAGGSCTVITPGGTAVLLSFLRSIGIYPDNQGRRTCAACAQYRDEVHHAGRKTAATTQGDIRRG